MDFISGAASLLEELDKELLVILRDGRKLFGILRSFDQFANIVLENTIERIFINDTYGEKNVGIFLIRGENVSIIGEIDIKKENQLLINKLKKVSWEEIKQRFDKEQAEKEEQAKLKKKIMLERGIIIDNFNIVDNLYFE